MWSSPHSHNFCFQSLRIRELGIRSHKFLKIIYVVTSESISFYFPHCVIVSYFYFFTLETEKNESSVSSAPQFSIIQNPEPPLLIFSLLSPSPPLAITSTKRCCRHKKKPWKFDQRFLLFKEIRKNFMNNYVLSTLDTNSFHKIAKTTNNMWIW